MGESFASLRDIYVGYPLCNTGDLLTPGKPDEMFGKFISHPFADFVMSRIDALRKLYNSDLQWGFIHCDAFSDNTLFSTEPVWLQGLIDWEDSCRGPIIVDLAVTSYACCFTANHEFMPQRFQSLLFAYTEAGRSIAAEEAKLFVDFMSAAALACAFYRFTEFVVKTDNTGPAIESYKFMHDRVLVLEAREMRQKIEGTLNAVCPFLG